MPEELNNQIPTEGLPSEPTPSNLPNKEGISMKQWDMNIIIAWGLVVMGVISIGGWIAYSIITGNSNGTEIPMAIVSGLTGALAGRNVPKKETYIEPVVPSRCNYPRREE